MKFGKKRNNSKYKDDWYCIFLLVFQTVLVSVVSHTAAEVTCVYKFYVTGILIWVNKYL